MNTVRYISLLSIFILLFAANAVAQQEQTTDVVGYEIPLDSAVCETMHGKKDAVDTVKEQIRSVMRKNDGQKVRFRILPAGSNATVIYWNDSLGETVLGTVGADGELCNTIPLGKYRYRIEVEEYFETEGYIELNPQDSVYFEEVSLRSKFVKVTFDADKETSVYLNSEFLGTGTVTRRLISGEYNVEWFRENYLSKMETVTVYEKDTITFRQPDLVPLTDTLSINSFPSGADVNIDGQYYGKTPIEIEVTVGYHELSISKYGYLPQNDDLLIVDGEAANRSYYLELEKKEVAVSAAVSNYTKAYEPIPAPVSAGKNFSSDEVEKGNAVASKKLSSYYVELAGNIGHLVDIGLNAGANLSDFNIEAYLSYGLQKDEFYSYEKTYRVKPVSFGCRIGFGISPEKNFLLTPQFGVGGLVVFGEDIRALATTLSLGVRCEWICWEKFGISITPEYAWGIKSDVMQKLSYISPAVASWCSGFGLRFGMSVKL